MKLVISFDELLENVPFVSDIDISNYWEMTRTFLENQFPEWGISEAFINSTFQIDLDNKEVSIELITI